MIQIRQGVFETNSSSTHSITMCMKSDYDAWKKGEVYLNEGWWVYSSTNPDKDKKFLTKDEVIGLIRSSGYFEDDDIDESISDEKLADEYEVYTASEWLRYNKDYLETYVEKFITPNGDEVIAFGEYGYDW